jgi:hypothetical protein
MSAGASWAATAELETEPSYTADRYGRRLDRTRGPDICEHLVMVKADVRLRDS